MKIYTKSGDKGTTSLVSGERVSKSSSRISAYGGVDELNSCIAVLRDQIEPMPGKEWRQLYDQLFKVQNYLFNIGSELATPSAEKIKEYDIRCIQPKQIKDLEDQIDIMSEKLPELKAFILPGGHLINSYAHLCRTVCRRVERQVVETANVEGVSTEVQVFLNRLSDWLFVVARYSSHLLSIDEVKWDRDLC